MQDIERSADEKVSKYRWVILVALWSTYMSSCIARLAIPAPVWALALSCIT
jgi:hypothetical protein